MHGRDHLPTGADPIPGLGEGGGGGGGIQFEVENEGGWLYVNTTDADAAGGSPLGQGLFLGDESSGGIGLTSGGGGNLILRTLAGGSINLRASSGGILIKTESLADGGINIQAIDWLTMIGAGGVEIQTNLGHPMIVRNSVLWLELNGAVLTLTDGGSNTFFKIDASSGASPTYHIKTGKSWVADL